MKTAIPCIKKYIVPAAKRIGADLFDTAAPETGEVVSGRKKLRTFSKYVGAKTVRKQLGGEKRKSNRRTRSISQKSRSKNGRSGKYIFHTIK